MTTITERITLTSARAALRAVGCTLKHEDGEYRVNMQGGSEATAYYTNDLHDAIATGRAMQAHRAAH